MSDFETIIRTMVKNGASAGDIARQARDIITTINNENSKETDRKNALNTYRNQYNKACAKKSFSVSDAVALCVSIVGDKHPEWGSKEMNEFYTNVMTSIEVIASMIGKTPTQALSEALNDWLKHIPNKSKEDRKTSISITGKKTLEDIMFEFINSI